MVIKGRSRSNGAQLADYLQRGKANDNVRLLEVRGTAKPEHLKQSLVEMSLTSELTKRGRSGLYHAQINPAIGEDGPMTHEDWLRAADILEKHLGFEGQKRAIVLHEKNGRLHGHVVWERYDHDTGRLRSDSQNFKRHDQARAEIEQEFGHQRTPQRAEREATHGQRLTELWEQHPEGQSFVRAAQEAGYRVAQGNDRRPFRVITPDGQSLNLVREIETANTRDVRARLQPIRGDLPTEAEALQQAKADRVRAAEREKLAREKSENLHEISDSQDLADAMKSQFKQHVTPNKEPEPLYSYGFKVEQPPSLPRDQDEKSLSEKDREKSDREQAERQRKMEQMKGQGQEQTKHRHPITGQEMSDDAWERFQQFMERQEERERERHGRSRGLEY